MKTFNKNKTVIVVLGPTAIGKTKMAIDIAKYYNTEIISADSRQFFAELKIGTAAPTDEELSQATHHFIGHLSIYDYYNVSRFEFDALQCAQTIFQKNDVAVLTGGSGLYIDAFCYGIDELPDPDQEVRTSLNRIMEQEGVEGLRFQLKRIDEAYYNVVDLANPKRIMRALEVFYATGQKYSDLRKNLKKERPFNILIIGLNDEREILFNRINDRVDNMIDNGLIEEAEKFYDVKYLNALNTVGYKELFSYFDKQVSLDKAIENIKTNTRRFAKRQLTWFNKRNNPNWFKPSECNEIISLIDKSIQI